MRVPSRDTIFTWSALGLYFAVGVMTGTAMGTLVSMDAGLAIGGICAVIAAFVHATVLILAVRERRRHESPRTK